MVAQLTPGGAASAALAAERAPSAGRAVHAVDLPGVLAPPRAGTVSLLGALAFQRLAELAPRLVLGIRLALQARSVPGVRPGLRIVRLRRRVSHVGLLPPRGYVHSLAYQVPPGRQPPRCRAAAGSRGQKGMNGRCTPECSARTVASGGASRLICSASSRASSSLLAPTTRNLQRRMTVRPSLRSLSASATASWCDGNSTLASHWATPVARDSAVSASSSRW